MDWKSHGQIKYAPEKLYKCWDKGELGNWKNDPLFMLFSYSLTVQMEVVFCDTIPFSV